MMRCVLSICFFILLLSSIKVGAQRASEPLFSAALDYYVQASLNNDSPYVGQQVIYTFRLYEAVSSGGAELNLPNFEGFWLGQQLAPRTRAELIDGRQYTIKEQDIQLYPVRVGEIRLNPAVYTLPNGLRFSTNPVILQVRPLPADAPPGFQGVVGQYVDLALSADRSIIKLGEPLTVDITITGVGSLEQMPAPVLSLPAGWRIYANKPQIAYTGGVVSLGVKRFRWIIVPVQEGAYEIPPVVFDYFDPQNNDYRALAAPPLTLQVLPGAAPSRDLTASQTYAPGLEILPARRLSPDLSWGGARPGWVLWLLSPAAALCAWVFVYRHQRLQRGLLQIRQSRALAQAQRRLRTAAKSGGQAAYGQTAEAIRQFVVEKSANRFTLEDVERCLREEVSSIDAAAAGQVLSCLQWAEEGRYAPVGREDIKPLVVQTIESLAKLDALWLAY